MAKSPLPVKLIRALRKANSERSRLSKRDLDFNEMSQNKAEEKLEGKHL